MFNIPFTVPDMSELEVQGASEAIRSGWITTGPKVKEFEKRIAEYCKCDYAVCLSSATAALEMTLRLLGIGRGDQVITCAYTYTASASVIDHVGADIVFVDSGRDSFEIDYDAVADAITEKTKAIIAVDLGGVICDYDKLFEAVRNKAHLFAPKGEVQEALGRVAVIADAAHGFGAVRDGKLCGEHADFTSFSFHAVKNLTTAEGGAVVWKRIDGVNNDELYRRYQLFSLHGQSKDAFAKTKAGAWEYDIEVLAYKCNMTDIMAGIGMAQLERYDDMLDKRHCLIQRYDDAFASLNLKTLIHNSPRHRSSGHLYLTRIDGITVEQRNKFIENMALKGISCNVHYKPLPMMTAYKNLGFDIKDYPNAYKQYENEISLPLHSRLTDEEQNYIIKCYTECLNELG